MKVKYIRWSTLQQTGSRQLLDFKSFDLVLQEQISGSIPFGKRPKGEELLKLIKQGKVTDLYVEEFSRLGRNALDVLTTLDICEELKVNVHIQNMNLSSMIKNKPNPIFKMISHVFLAMGEQEKELTKERTEMGKIAARLKGVKFGRKIGTNEREKEFLEKKKNKDILKYLNAGELSMREVSKLTNASTTTILKVKAVATKLKMLEVKS